MDQPDQETPPAEHHIWCNFFMRPVEECTMCKGLWAEYPYTTDEEVGGLMKKHFPQNVERR